MLHLGGIAALLPLALPLLIQTLVIIIVLISLYYNLSLHSLLRFNQSINALCWFDDNEWQLTQRDGNKLHALLTMNSYLYPQLTILNFNLLGSKKTRTVIIFFDAIDENTFRQLRVRLRLLQSKTRH